MLSSDIEGGPEESGQRRWEVRLLTDQCFDLVLAHDGVASIGGNGGYASVRDRRPDLGLQFVSPQENEVIRCTETWRKWAQLDG